MGFFELLKSLLGIGIAATLISLLATFVKGLANSGLLDPEAFPNVVNRTLINMNAWGGGLGSVVTAMLGVLLVFVLLRVVVTLL